MIEVVLVIAAFFYDADGDVATRRAQVVVPAMSTCIRMGEAMQVEWQRERPTAKVLYHCVKLTRPTRS